MAISHGFNKTEAATSVTAPVTVNSGLQIVVKKSICREVFVAGIYAFLIKLLIRITD